MVKSDQGPIGDHTDNPDATIEGWTSDQILDTSGVEQLDIRHRQNLAHQSRHEQGSMFNDDIIALVLIRHANVVQEGIRWLAQNHGREELTAQPATATRAHGSLNDGDLKIWSRL